MILADTSIWISFLRNDDQDIRDMLKSYLKRDEVYIISPIIGELLQGVRSNRERGLVESLWEGLPRPDEEGLIITAGVLSNENKFYAKGIGLIDCYILAAAIHHDLALWTLDKKLMQAADDLSAA